MRRAPHRARRRLALAATLLLASQAGVAQVSSPDVPAGPATVVVRLLHETRPEATAGIDVLLYALAADGSAGLRQGRTDAEGRFRFEGVSNAPEVVYLVGARAGEVPFGTRFQFAEGALEHQVELALSDAVSDTAGAQAGGIEIRVGRGCTHLHLRHAHELRNAGPQVVYVPEAQRATAAPILEVELPAEADGFEPLAGGEGLVREGRRVRFWGPLHPGEQTVEFGYGMPIGTASIRIGLPAGAAALAVLAPRGVLGVSSDALAAAPDRTLDGQPHAALRGTAIAPGALELAIRSEPTGGAASDAARTLRAELWLELDDAALEVNERLLVEVDGAAGAVASEGVPLLCVPLPPGAGDLRFSADTLRAGLRRDPSGDLAIHGPFPPGASELAWSYRLAASGAGAELARRFDRALPLLSVLIADTGVIAETDRLHRRRAVRMDDRTWQHLEAFAVEPLEAIAITLRRTAPAGGGGRWATAGFAVLAGLAALLFLTGPLRGGEPEREEAPEPDAAVRARDAIVRSLEDLEEDLETGKISPADHAAMRSELRSRAAAALLATAEPAAPRPGSAAAAGAAEVEACPGCGAAHDPGARFCTRCGVALACAACGAAARPGDLFCSQCGAKLAAGAPRA